MCYSYNPLSALHFASQAVLTESVQAVLQIPCISELSPEISVATYEEPDI
jgi:hypothetical protein